MAKQQTVVKRKQAVTSRIKKSSNTAKRNASRKSKRSLPVDVGRIQGRLLYSVSEKHLHSEVLRHRENEKRADGIEVLKAMEAKHG